MLIKSSYQNQEHELKTLKKIQNIFDKSSLVAVSWKNEKGYPVEFISNNVAHLIGYTVEEVMSGSINYKEVVHGGDLQKSLEEIRLSGESKEDECSLSPFKIICKNKELKWIEGKIYREQSRSGKVRHIEGIFKDVTERVKAENALKESEDRLSLIYNKMNIRMILLKVTGVEKYSIESVNDFFVQNLSNYGIKCSKDEIIGISLLQYYSSILNLSKEEIKQRFIILNKTCTEKKVKHKHFESLFNNGQRNIEEVNITPILRNGECKKILIVVHNITELKRANEREISVILAAEDRERKRLAKELHDGLGQYLTIASLSFNYLKRTIAELDEEYSEKFQNGIKFLNIASEEARNISHNLMPQSICDFGYVRTIENLIEDLKKTIKIEFVFYNNLNGGRMAAPQELNLFRITQEAINNILKHSEASKVTLQLMKHPNSIVLTIADNGKGFVPDQFNKDAFGLQSMKARADILFGSFNIDSTIDKGTLITVEIPIKITNTKIDHGKNNAR